jgi:YaiO family outer membrane protein
MYKGSTLRSILFLFAFIFLSAVEVQAQDSTTADGLYSIARQQAFDNKNYPAAIATAKRALAMNPKYTDIVVFIGRVYAWDKQADSSRVYFEKALIQNPLLEDVYIAYSDLEFWNDNDSTALELVQRGLSYNPSSVPLLIRKARLLNETKDFMAAISVIDTILSIDRGNTEARALASQIRDNVSQNRIGIKYDYVHFDKQFPDPWQFLSLDYTRQTKAGSYTARLNYANRFAANGLQYELEAYPRISRTFYTYANLAYSDDVGVFPKWRAGASLYANLPKAWEAEAGIRYLYFTSNAFIYTVYVGKYYRSFLFGARTYLAPAANNMSHSYSLLARYYYGGIDDFVGINLGAGLSPDDRRVNVQLNDVYKLRTYRAELTWRHAIRKLNIITLNASVLNQEYRPATIGNQFQFGIGYIRRF